MLSCPVFWEAKAMNDKKHAPDDLRVIKLPMPRLDASATGELQMLVKESLDSGFKRIVLDLSGIKFMDSSGLTGLVLVFKNVTGIPNGKVVICGLNPPIKSLMRITKMDLAIETFDTQEEAVTALQ